MNLIDEINKNFKRDEEASLEQFIDLCKKVRIIIDKQAKYFENGKNSYCEEFEQYIKYIMKQSELGISADRLKEFETDISRQISFICRNSSIFENTDFGDIALTSMTFGRLTPFVIASNIFEIHARTSSWEDIDKIVKNIDAGSSFPIGFLNLSRIMIKYYDLGVEFTDRYCPGRVEREAAFAEDYNKAKERLQSQFSKDTLVK